MRPDFIAQTTATPVGGVGLSPVAERVAALNARYRHHGATDVLRHALTDPEVGRLALVSSFGAESAVLLDMVAGIDPATPVLFLDTGKLFGETLRYRNELIARLGLTDVRSIRPDAGDLAAVDPEGIVWASAPDRCCLVRKTLPLERALAPFQAWITGRKRFQAVTRAALPAIEAADGKVKLNPLADWDQARLAAYMAERDLPAHPLVADGFLSIGCMPCTDRVAPGEDPRAGRWRGQGKVECGIHLSGMKKGAA